MYFLHIATKYREITLHLSDIITLSLYFSISLSISHYFYIYAFPIVSKKLDGRGVWIFSVSDKELLIMHSPCYDCGKELGH